MSIHDRFKSERERLALTQPGVAELVGVGKTTVINWEKGASSPTAVQLAALAEVGVDVLFVLTGQRSQPVPEAATLSPRQRALLDNFDNTSEEGRKIIEGTADMAAKSTAAQLHKKTA